MAGPARLAFGLRPWLGALGLPAAVVVTARDRSVPPRKQRELAERLGARLFEDQGDHDSVVLRGREFAAVLLEALDAVSEKSPAHAA